MTKNLAVLLLGLILLFSPQLLPRSETSWIVPKGQLGFIVVDVGSEGDAQLVISPNSKSMLVDTGDSGERVAWSNLKTVLTDNKVSELDILVITHPHQDHIGNVMEVLRDFRPKKVVLTGVVHTNQTYEEMLTFIRDQNIPAVPARTGDSLDFDDNVVIDILGPNDLTAGNLNNTSVIVKLSYGNFRVIITGDAEVEQERQQLAAVADKLPTTVLKAGHHGSATSSSLEYLKDTAPGLVIISAGSGNQYGHPHQQTLSRLEELGILTLITRDRGTITVTTDGETYEIKTSK